MPSLNIALRNILAAAFGDDVNTGIVRVYDGAAPTDADTAVGAQTLLAEITLPADAMVAGGNGEQVKSGTWDDQDINASGAASWFRIMDPTEARVLQGTVTGSGGGGDMEVDDINFVAGGVFTITAFSVTMPGA